MPPSDLSSEQIAALAATRHAKVGLLYPEPGLTPYYDWLIRTVHRLAEASASDFRVMADADSASSVWVSPGRASISGTALAFEGGAYDLAAFNNSTALVWLEDVGGVATIGTDALGAGWPASPHLRLAEVVVSAGQVQAITDLRFETMLKV